MSNKFRICKTNSSGSKINQLIYESQTDTFVCCADRVEENKECGKAFR